MERTAHRPKMGWAAESSLGLDDEAFRKAALDQIPSDEKLSLLVMEAVGHETRPVEMGNGEMHFQYLKSQLPRLDEVEWVELPHLASNLIVTMTFLVAHSWAWSLDQDMDGNVTCSIRGPYVQLAGGEAEGRGRTPMEAICVAFIDGRKAEPRSVSEGDK